MCWRLKSCQECSLYIFNMDKSRKPPVCRYYSLPNIPLNSISQTRRRSLIARQQDKPFYKVAYPLKNRKKYGIKDDCNAAPNAEYTVTGRGYTFTRHNNKFTMNINTDVFFDDKPVPMCQVALSARVRDEEPKRGCGKAASFAPTLPSVTTKKHQTQFPTQNPQNQSIQLIEKKNQILFALTAQLEEQKQHNQIQEIKLIEEHEAKRKEMLEAFEKEKRELIGAQEQEFTELQAQYAKELVDHHATAMSRETLLKIELEKKYVVLREIKRKYECDSVLHLQLFEEEVKALHQKEIENLKTDFTKDLEQQRATRLKELEKKNEELIVDQTTKYQRRIEELAKFENCQEMEQNLKTTMGALKNIKMEIAQLKLKEKDMDRQIKDGERKIKELKKKLTGYRTGEPQDKMIEEVKEKNGSIINELRMQNIDLSCMLYNHIRRRLRKATEELYHLPVEERKCLNIQKDVSLTPSGTSGSPGHGITERLLESTSEDVTESSSTKSSSTMTMDKAKSSNTKQDE